MKPTTILYYRMFEDDYNTMIKTKNINDTLFSSISADIFWMFKLTNKEKGYLWKWIIL